VKASAPESDSEVKATIIAIVTYDRGYCSFVPFFLFLFPSIFFLLLLLLPFSFPFHFFFIIITFTFFFSLPFFYYYYFYLLPFCWGAGEGEGGGLSFLTGYGEVEAVARFWLPGVSGWTGWH